MRKLVISAILVMIAPGCAVHAQGTMSATAPDCGEYLYRANIVRVIDGDTVVADIDLGFRTWRRGEHLRLYGIDAPERAEQAGKDAEELLRTRIEGQRVYVCTIKSKRSDREARGSFGRYLTVIHKDGENINDWMVRSGSAVRYRE